MNTISDDAVIQAMRYHGGGFVRALAEAAVRADSVNLSRIKTAFAGIWEHYAGMAEYLQQAKESDRHRMKQRQKEEPTE